MAKIIKKQVPDWAETLIKMGVGETVVCAGVNNLNNARRSASYYKQINKGVWEVLVLFENSFVVKRIE